MRRIAGVAVVLLFLSAARPAGAAERQPVTYRPPVPGPVTDPFRPPATPYGAGNRGVDYDTRPGDSVRAAAPGEVVFAGAIGPSAHVVVLHADGIRTSYSFLRSAAVARGNRVAAGEVVGAAGDTLHFGARAGEAYIDPAVLLAGDGRVHLVPDGTAASATRPQSEARERAGLISFVWGGATAVGRGAARVASVAADVASDLPPVDQVRHALSGLDDLRTRGIHRPTLPGESQIRTALDVARRVIDRRPCTPADEPLPPPPTERRFAVLVGGLGSASGAASVLDVGTVALGYAPDDVLQFSYRGGNAAANPYGPEDTLVDIRESGRRLRELLERLQYEHPGVPVDVIAHSQGGLVARSALGDELDPFDPRTPRIGTLITLGTPHRGANLATAAALLRYSPTGRRVRDVAGAVGRRRGIDPNARSIKQLAETSDFIGELNRRPLPDGVRAVSIAARRDLIVPSPRAKLRGAENVIVTLPGVGTDDHAHLPGSAPAQREIALALAGRPPTCESAADMATDALTGAAIDQAERAAGIAAAGAAASTGSMP